MRPHVLGALGALLASLYGPQAQAQNATTLGARVEPLVYSKGGVPMGCGVNFVAANTDEQAITGSVVVWFFPAKSQTALMVKIVGLSMAGSALEQVPVTAGWLRTGQHTTRGGFERSRSDDPKALILMRHSLHTTEKGSDIMATFIPSMLDGFTVSFSQGSGFDAVFDVRSPKNAGPTADTYFSCMDALLAEVLRHFGG